MQSKYLQKKITKFKALAICKTHYCKSKKILMHLCLRALTVTDIR